jgi:hypothetical protein
MKTCHRILLLALLLMALPLSHIPAQPPASQDEVWIQIRFLDKGAAQPVTEYYGLIRKDDFAAMRASEKPNEFLRVSHVAWMENGTMFQLSDTNANGAKFGFKNVMYVRADTILRIIELDDTFVTQRLLPLKE